MKERPRLEPLRPVQGSHSPHNTSSGKYRAAGVNLTAESMLIGRLFMPPALEAYLNAFIELSSVFSSASALSGAVVLLPAPLAIMTFAPFR